MKDQIKNSSKPLRILNQIGEDAYSNLMLEFNWVESQQELIYCIKNEITAAPICELSTCDNIIKFSEANRKYNLGCCKSHTQMVNRRNSGKPENLKMSEESTVKRKNTMTNRYGVDNPMKCDEIKERQQLMMLKKYGCVSPINNNEIKLRIKKTNLERYGVDNPMKNKDIQTKLIETNLERYGVDCVFYNDGVQEKKQATCYEKYGVRFPLQSPIFLDQVKESKILKYGVEYPFQSTDIQIKIANSNKYGSKNEKMIIEMISKYFDVVTNDRKTLNGQELDIFIPGKNIAIEFDGIYWHSEKQGKDKNYHLNKTLECEKQGIQLIHIFETEWTEKKEIVESIIKSKLGKFDKRIYARKCQIKEINTKIKNKFLEENHLQGQDKSVVKLGLFHNDELVSVMTFGHSRFNKNYQYEMHRFCNKLDCQIIGGASKLFKYFINNYSPDSIITYADRRYSDGTFYEKIGFVRTRVSKPNFFIINKNKLENRLQWQKHKLKDKLSNFDEKLSAWENIKLHGYNRIWDCGNYVYIWEKIVK